MSHTAVLASLCCGLLACNNESASNNEAAGNSEHAAANAAAVEGDSAPTDQRRDANLMAAATASKLAASSSSSLANDQFLPVDEAFKLDFSSDTNATELVWIVAPEYYLYKHKFKILAHYAGGAEAQDITASARFAPGLHKTDEYFGRVEVFYHQAVAALPSSPGSKRPAALTVQYQGCADAGLCYPVQTRKLELR